MVSSLWLRHLRTRTPFSGFFSRARASSAIEYSPCSKMLSRSLGRSRSLLSISSISSACGQSLGSSAVPSGPSSMNRPMSLSSPAFPVRFNSSRRPKASYRYKPSLRVDLEVIGQRSTVPSRNSRATARISELLPQPGLPVTSSGRRRYSPRLTASRISGEQRNLRPSVAAISSPPLLSRPSGTSSPCPNGRHGGALGSRFNPSCGSWSPLKIRQSVGTLGSSITLGLSVAFLAHIRILAVVRVALRVVPQQQNFRERLPLAFALREESIRYLLELMLPQQAIDRTCRGLEIDSRATRPAGERQACITDQPDKLLPTAAFRR